MSSPPTVASSPPHPLAGTVLLADPDAATRLTLTNVLSPRYEVLTATDGVAAIEIMRTRQPDVVICELVLTRLDGLGLLKTIRSRGDLRTIPVIVLSSRHDEEARIAGLEAGADDFLAKPCNVRELLARVNVHLQMARIRGQAEDRERELRTNAEVFAHALRESSERLSASLAAAGTGTFRWDLRTHSFAADDSLDRLFGLPFGRGVRSLTEFTQIVHPDDRARVMAACERCAQEGADFEMELRVRRPDGSTCWVDGKGRTAFDEDGRPVYLTGACVDISKRKHMETFVWRQKDVLEQIVRGATLADVLEALTLDIEHIADRPLIATVLMVEPDGVHMRPTAGRRCPPAWIEAIDGLVIGPASGSCGAAAFRRERVVVRDVMTSPLWEGYRAQAVKHGLRACWSTPILSSRGAVLGTFAIYYPGPSAPTDEELHVVDIVTRTAAIAVERHQAEAALRESQAQLAEHAQTLERRVSERTLELQETISELESFSYSISHDMRAPLRAMQGFAQILSEDFAEQLGPEGKDYLRRIVGATDRMDRLIQDVLIYSRVTRTELKLVAVSLDALLQGILESYPRLQPPHARIEIAPALPRVQGNEAALTQCFSNLLGNAIKFVPAGKTPEVRIWAETHGDRVRVFVRDNGIGIERDAYEKIFNIFYQLDRKFEGTGIGLAVVRKAAERMGGSVGLESEPNRGSTFHVELALAS